MDARLLACFAHPDDETFSCAGVMLLNRRRGIHNSLVCATRGESGEISDPDLATPETLAIVRTQELECAAARMGVDDLHFLGYRDSGMAGAPDNQRNGAYATAPDSAVVVRLVRLIRELRPQVVITFDPTGGYGHPDHIAIHRHTLAAARLAADPAFAPHDGPPWQIARLFYPALDIEAFRAISSRLVAQGDPLPTWGGEDGVPLWPEQSVDAKIDIGGVVAAKWDAFRCHQTQIGANHPFMRVPADFAMGLFREEWFEQAYPAEKPAQPYTDLFEGLL
jgi:LmbE family N-acetylglucosaminyl deacetylase